MNSEDPFAMFRPQNKNEKPDVPDNDPFFSFRPENVKKQFKESTEKQPLPDNFPGESAPWYEKWFGGFAMQPNLYEKKTQEAGKDIGRSFLSGTTLGGSELYKPLKVKDKDEGLEVVKMAGSLLPIDIISKAFNNPLTKLASKSPIAKKALTSLAEMTGWGLTGATEKVLTDAFQGKMPTAEDVLVHGTEWAALDAILKTVGGLSGKFATWVLGKSKSSNIVPWQVINDLLTDMKKDGIDISQTDRVTARILSELKPNEKYIPVDKVKSNKEIRLSKEVPPETTEKIGTETLKNLPEKTANNSIDLLNKKIDPVQFKKISANSQILVEPYKPKEIDTENAIQSIQKGRAEELIENLGERASTEKQLGENIKNNIEESFKESEKVYKPLYEEIESASKKIYHKPIKTIGVVNDILDQINSLKTKPEGYQKVITTLNDSLSDMGYHVMDVKGKILIKDSAGNPIKLKNLSVQEEIPLSKTMELARRLNKIADYDIIGPSIKNTLKRPINSLKTEIKETLKAVNPELHNKFVQAENEYAQTAKKFGNDSISGIRGQSTSEKIATKILEPTTLEKLKNIVNPTQYNEIQREILQKLQDMPFEKARRTYREISPFLDKNAQDAARSVISHKSPTGKFAPVKKIQSGIIADLNKAFTTGQRPDKVLNLWKTVKGQKLIEEALEGTPNKKEILEYLKKQSFYDFTSSIIDKSGVIDFVKLNDYLIDPATIRNLNLIGGEEAVKFFKSLKNMSSGIKFNLRRLENLPKIKIENKFADYKTAYGEYQSGKEKLLKGAEKIKKLPKETEKFKEIYFNEEPEKFLKESKKSETIANKRGRQKLKEAAKARQPFKFKLEQVLDDYGFNNVKGFLTTLGIVKYTGKTMAYFVAENGAKILYKMATNPKSTKSINKLLNTSKTAENTKNIAPFIFALSDMEENLEKSNEM